MFFRRVAENAPLLNGQRKRFFAYDVLAGLNRHERRNRVPMVGRDYVDDVDIFAIDQVAKIVVLGAGLVVGSVFLGVMIVNLFGALNDSIALCRVAFKSTIGAG